MSNEQNQVPVSLVDPNVPADQGLSSLGLLMQLGGSLFAAVMSLATFMALLAMGGRGGGSEKLVILLILGASLTRSIFHRAAGTEILYGRRTLDGVASPLSGVKRYIAIGIGHSALVFLILTGKFHMDMKLGLGIFLGLASWPATLAVLMTLPRFRRFNTEMPVSEDKGFEGASILMTVLGTCGLLGSAAILILLMSAGGGRALSSGPGVLIMLAVILLCIRSALHVQAGLSGLRQTGVDRAVELANRYANFGVISSFCTAGALLLMIMSLSRGHFDPTGLIVIVGMCWMLMAWPLIIRRFYSERQFADLMAGEGGAYHRRAPDAGLSGLGWLLFAHAMMSAAMLIPQLLVSPENMSRSMAESMMMLGNAGMRSIWWSAGLVALQAWAGFELVRMSSTHRIIGTVYAIVAIIISVYLTWPVLQQMKYILRGGPETMMMFLPMAIQLVIPIATLVLVNRNIAPTAQARFRTPPAPQA